MCYCGKWSDSELLEWMEEENAELVDYVEGSLIDNCLYALPDGSMVIALETVLNCWSSALTVRCSETAAEASELYDEFDALHS